LYSSWWLKNPTRAARGLMASWMGILIGLSRARDSRRPLFIGEALH
jgi:hypothetical protein